jgi:molecular chaperone GrpE
VSEQDGNGVEPHEADAEAQAEADGDPPSAAPLDPLAALTAERDKIKDQLLRTAADFDNFRKRTRRDLEDAERNGKEEVIQEMLPVIDNLERAVAASATATDAASVADGVRMVLKQFEDTCQKLGLERVRAAGERFDPSQHDAVQQMETSEHPPGTIVKEIVPGYRLGGKLVRAALVVVARPPAGGGDGGDGASGAESGGEG